MTDISVLIKKILAEHEPELLSISTETAGIKPVNNKWSKKEILGHLIDSANVNFQRFIRTIMHKEAEFPPYDQEEWVELQKYNDREWAELIQIFVSFNLQIANLLKNLNPERERYCCDIGGEKPVTLEVLIVEYIRHMEHHLRDIENRQLIDYHTDYRRVTR